jgi:hypothetical protein
MIKQHIPLLACRQPPSQLNRLLKFLSAAGHADLVQPELKHTDQSIISLSLSLRLEEGRNGHLKIVPIVCALTAEEARLLSGFTVKWTEEGFQAVCASQLM